MAPAGMSAFAWLPAPVFNSVVLAGMSKTTQCQKPLPVGASGSYMVIAKLFVPAGTFSQYNSGERLSPVHPNPLYTCLSVACPPISLLFKVKVCACEKIAEDKMIIAKITLLML